MCLKYNSGHRSSVIQNLIQIVCAKFGNTYKLPAVIVNLILIDLPVFTV